MPRSAAAKRTPTRKDCDVELRKLTAKLMAADHGSEQRAILRLDIDRWLELRFKAAA